MRIVDPKTGITLQSFDDVLTTGSKGLCVTGQLIGVITTSGITYFDQSEQAVPSLYLETSTGHYGTSGTDPAVRGSFGGVITAIQNSWTGQVCLARMAGDDVTFNTFIPSVAETPVETSAFGSLAFGDMTYSEDEKTGKPGVAGDFTAGLTVEDAWRD